MKKIVVFILFLVLPLFVVTPPTHALEKARAVVMPISGPLTAGEKPLLEQKLASLFSDRYKVLSGAEVTDYAAKVIREENKKEDCDLQRCYTRIAARFNAEVLIAFKLLRRDETSLSATLVVYDVVDGKDIRRKTEVCEQCTVDKLSALLEKMAR
jgi:hypothetical protein